MSARGFLAIDGVPAKALPALNKLRDAANLFYVFVDDHEPDGTLAFYHPRGIAIVTADKELARKMLVLLYGEDVIGAQDLCAADGRPN